MGSPSPEISGRHGDFVDWVRRKLPEDMAAAAQVLDPAAGVLPDPAGVDGLIITGSRSMVTDPSASERTAFRWLEKVLRTEIPVLGLCYGHQMLGHVFGGEVGPLPGGPEIGIAEIEFAAGGDPLFAPCGARQRVAVIHWQSLLRLPAGAQVLGGGTREPHHAVRFQPRVWGVHFHPEFSPEVLTDLAGEHPDVLRESGRDPDHVAVETSQWREETGVISRFAGLQIKAVS